MFISRPFVVISDIDAAPARVETGCATSLAVGLCGVAPPRVSRAASLAVMAVFFRFPKNIAGPSVVLVGLPDGLDAERAEVRAEEEGGGGVSICSGREFCGFFGDVWTVVVLSHNRRSSWRSWRMGFWKLVGSRRDAVGLIVSCGMQEIRKA